MMALLDKYPTTSDDKAQIWSLSAWKSQQPKKHILVFSGVSGAGKDTCAEGVYYLVDSVVVKFVAHTKRYVESSLCLPDGFMDNRVLRNQRIVCPITGKHEDITYLDLLVKMYHERLNSYAKLTLPRTGADIDAASTRVVCITDMRSPLEAEYLKKHYRNQVVHIRVIGRGRALSSDEHMTECESILPVQYMVDNSRDKVALRSALATILQQENII